MARSAKDYGLVPLTYAEAARVLGTTEGEFRVWVAEVLKPSVQRDSHWRTGTRAIPEAVIRLYLTRALEQRGAAKEVPGRDVAAAAARRQRRVP